MLFKTCPRCRVRPSPRPPRSTSSGMACIVGPSMSKSNIIDAWRSVMGAGGVAEVDIIFARTFRRARWAGPRCSDHRRAPTVPADQLHQGHRLADHVPRRGSEYAINGHAARLLDVQDLLSDSGIGRRCTSSSVTVSWTPSSRPRRRAGAASSRRRPGSSSTAAQEKALRKPRACEENLTRLQDLITEIRRQLKPLGRQAEVARKAAVVQADVRDAKARLIADDLVQVQVSMASTWPTNRP